MRLVQTTIIPVSLDAVWGALNDPGMLQNSLPNCDSFEPNEEGGFDLSIRARIGPVSARFSGKIELSNVNPKTSYRLTGFGTGGVAGHAKGSVNVWLEALDTESTLLKYSVEASIGGKLAQVGARLIDGAARKMANDFFTRFVRLLCKNESLNIVLETVHEAEEDNDESSHH